MRYLLGLLLWFATVSVYASPVPQSGQLVTGAVQCITVVSPQYTVTNTGPSDITVSLGVGVSVIVHPGGSVVVQPPQYGPSWEGGAYVCPGVISVPCPAISTVPLVIDGSGTLRTTSTTAEGRK